MHRCFKSSFQVHIILLDSISFHNAIFMLYEYDFILFCRCLLVDRKLHYSPVAAAKITNACCVLHNIAHRAHIPYTPLTAEEAARCRRMEAVSSRARMTRERRERALSELQVGRARQQALIQRLWADRTTNY